MATLVAPLPAPRPQDWFGAPRVPEIFRSDDPADEPQPPGELHPQETPRNPARLPAESSSSEREWGRGLTALDLRAWQHEDDLRVIREWAGETLFGLPLLLPQLTLEAFVPRGIRVGPTTYLYRTSPASPSMTVVVIDQMLFHEAEFFARVQEKFDDHWVPDDLTRGQRNLFRRSFMRGLRASYDLPGLDLPLVVRTVSDQGAVGLLLVPSIGGALLYFKGLDQKFDVEDTLRFRVKLACAQDWVEAVDSKMRMRLLSFDIRVAGVPLGIVGTLELSRRGMEPAFIGIGTSLSAVDDVLGREARRGWRME
jgi:hypothetical protein